jgi:hypothetical protein
VFIGNGQPALLERVSTLETQFAQFMVICTECRRVVYGPSPAEKKPDVMGLAEVAKAAVAANADVKKAITVESWEFWAAVVSGLCGLVAAALARHPHAIAIAKFGGTCRPHERYPFDRARGRFRVGQRQPVGIDAQIDGRITHIGIGIDHAFNRGDAEAVESGERILIEVRAVQREPDSAVDDKAEADPDQANAVIFTPQHEANNRNEKREEQNFNRQVKCRGERDPDEPASAQVDEWHSRADP